MSDQTLLTLANAFHAAAEEMRTPSNPHVILKPNGEAYPQDPAESMSRRISADVLAAIGNVYLGQANADA